MWSVRQLAIFITGALAGSENTECGAFTRYTEPGYEVCSDDYGCYKIQIRCPDGYTSSFENSIKCKGGEWKGHDGIISCDANYKNCDYEGLPGTGEDVQVNCSHNSCTYSCADGSEVNAPSAKCDTMFGEWVFAGWEEKPGKIRCAGFPKPPKEPKDKDHCEAFTNFDANSVDVVSCDNKRCSFQCKDGFHSITSDQAKCRSAGYWKLNDGADTVSSLITVVTPGLLQG